MGPIILFDKSFLQGLSVDESVWFDHFFYPVVSPVFFVETLADLYKSPREGRTAEEEVGLIAIKTPQLSGAPCLFHEALCHANLEGYPIPMTGQIPRAGIRIVRKEGKLGGVASESAEARAFHRWQEGKFLAVEREQAMQWRAAIKNIDLESTRHVLKSFLAHSEGCKSIAKAHDLAQQAVRDLARTSGRFDAALELLKVPKDTKKRIKNRWKRLSKPNFDTFSPYAAHVLTVELFFIIAIGANLIASTRPTNRVDIAYLHYLPFCSVFASSDKLHRLCAGVFLRPDQSFVWGLDLKQDLSSIDRHYKLLPEEVRAAGIFEFANHVPDIDLKVMRQLYEKHTNLKIGANADNNHEVAGHGDLLSDSENWHDAPSMGSETKHDEEIETLTIERLVSPVRGSWVQLTRAQAGHKK